MLSCAAATSFWSGPAGTLNESGRAAPLLSTNHATYSSCGGHSAKLRSHRCTTARRWALPAAGGCSLDQRSWLFTVLAPVQPVHALGGANGQPYATLSRARVSSVASLVGDGGTANPKMGNLQLALHGSL